MTDVEYKQLAQLVTYLLESEDWKSIWINEYAEPIRLFMFKTKIKYRKINKYIKNAMNKLIGPIFRKTQQRLANKCCGGSDILFKPKTETEKLKEYRKTPHPRKVYSPKGKTLTPRSEFGKLYVSHYGYGAGINKEQYDAERRFYMKNKHCSWE